MSRPSRSSLSASTPDSLSDNESGLGTSRYVPRKPSYTPSRGLTPGGSRSGSKPNSRPASRGGSKPPSHHGSSLSLDSTGNEWSSSFAFINIYANALIVNLAIFVQQMTSAIHVSRSDALPAIHQRQPALEHVHQLAVRQSRKSLEMVEFQHSEAPFHVHEPHHPLVKHPPGQSSHSIPIYELDNTIKSTIYQFT